MSLQSYILSHNAIYLLKLAIARWTAYVFVSRQGQYYCKILYKVKKHKLTFFFIFRRVFNKKISGRLLQITTLLPFFIHQNFNGCPFRIQVFCRAAFM